MNKLEENIARMEKELAEMKATLEEKKRGGVALETADELWWLDSGGYVRKSTTSYKSHTTMSQGKFFTSEEAAKEESKRRKLVQKMRISAKSAGGVDWADIETQKYFPYFWEEMRMHLVGHTANMRHSQLPHFPTEASLMDFMATLTKEQQELLICGVD